MCLAFRSSARAENSDREHVAEKLMGHRLRTDENGVSFSPVNFVGDRRIALNKSYLMNILICITLERMCSWFLVHSKYATRVCRIFICSCKFLKRCCRSSVELILHGTLGFEFFIGDRPVSGFMESTSKSIATFNEDYGDRLSDVCG